jgi:TrmH family RNA methyltransferase
MSAPTVVVVEPQTPGNVGTIARAMKNFGFSDLKLVDPPELDRDGEAYGFAGQAREDVLPNADEVAFDEVVENYHTVGMTAITNEDCRKHTRFPFVTPDEMADELATVETDTAILFGREDNGLANDELERVDQIGAIPASADYSSLNLGQAATVTLYELRDLTLDETQLPDRERERAAQPAIERLHDEFSSFLAAVGHPEEKRGKTERMLRRFVGRAHPTEREASRMTGLFRKAAAGLDDRGDDADGGRESP